MKTKQKIIKRKMREELEDLDELRSLGKSGLKIRHEELKLVNSQLFKIKRRLGHIEHTL